MLAESRIIKQFEMSQSTNLDKKNDRKIQNNPLNNLCSRLSNYPAINITLPRFLQLLKLVAHFPFRKSTLILVSSTTSSFRVCFVTGAPAAAVSVGSAPHWHAWVDVALQRHCYVSEKCFHYPQSLLFLLTSFSTLSHTITLQEGLGSCYGSSCVLMYFLCILTSPPQPHLPI